MEFPIHTIDSASPEAQKLLDDAKRTFGWVPNLSGVMASNPQLLQGYMELHKLFQKSGFNNEELTVVWQTINVEAKCHYCVPAHAAIADWMKVDPEITQALRNKTKLPNEKLQTLHETTLSLVRNRGRLSEDELNTFEKAGYTQQHILGIVLGMAQKVMSNYTNHLANTPLDEKFQKYA